MPVTPATPGSRTKRSPSARSQPRSTSTSSSVKATISPSATAMPALRAAEMPGRRWATTRTGAISPRRASTSSPAPPWRRLSTTTIS